MASNGRYPSLTEQMDSTLLRVPGIVADLAATAMRIPLLMAQLATSLLLVPFIGVQMVTGMLAKAAERMDGMVEQNVKARHVYQRGEADSRMAERLGDMLAAPRPAPAPAPQHTPPQHARESYAPAKPLAARQAS